MPLPPFLRRAPRASFTLKYGTPPDSFGEYFGRFSSPNAKTHETVAPPSGTKTADHPDSADPLEAAILRLHAAFAAPSRTCSPQVKQASVPMTPPAPGANLAQLEQQRQTLLEKLRAVNQARSLGAGLGGELVGLLAGTGLGIATRRFLNPQGLRGTIRRLALQRRGLTLTPQQMAHAGDAAVPLTALLGGATGGTLGRTAAHLTNTSIPSELEQPATLASAPALQQVLAKRADQVEKGNLLQRGISTTAGNVLGTAALMPLFGGPEFYFPSRLEDEKKVFGAMRRAEPEALQTTKLRLGGGDVVDDLLWRRENKDEQGKPLRWYHRLGGRLLHNKRTSPLGKALGYASAPYWLMSDLLKSPHYNPVTDVATNYFGRSPAITSHELGHAIDFNRNQSVQGSWLKRLPKQVLRDLYMLGNAIKLPAPLPPVNPLPALWYEPRANLLSGDALRHGLRKDPETLRRISYDRTAKLPAAYSTYVSGMFPPLAPLALPIAAALRGGGVAAARYQYGNPNPGRFGVVLGDDAKRKAPAPAGDKKDKDKDKDKPRETTKRAGLFDGQPSQYQRSYRPLPQQAPRGPATPGLQRGLGRGLVGGMVALGGTALYQAIQKFLANSGAAKAPAQINSAQTGR